jgi:hypothetical protein
MTATLVGKWIRAGALERHDEIDRVSAAITQTGGMVRGRIEVVLQTLATGVERWLGTTSMPEMHLLIDRFLDRFQHADPPLLFVEVEAVIRGARGELAPIDAMTGTHRFLISKLLFSFLCIDGTVPQHVIDELIAEGERRASEAGFEIRTPEEIAMTGHGG